MAESTDGKSGSDKPVKSEKIGTETTDAAEVLEKVPERIFKQFFGAVFKSGTSIHPVFERFDAEHVHKWLDYSNKDDERNFELTKSARQYQLVYVLVALLFLSVMTWFLLPQNKDLLQDIIKILVGFAGGFGFGYGIRAAKQKD